MGHALRKALSVIAAIGQRPLADVAAQAGAEMVSAASLKAALDLDWDDPTAKTQALATILQALAQVEAWVQPQMSELEEPEQMQVQASLAAARQVQAADVEEATDGSPKLRQGVAKDRRISIEDEQMRHGRKSRSLRNDSYKRHVLTDLDYGLVRAVGITPANVAEASVTDAIEADLACQAVQWQELHIDRADLTSNLVKNRPADLTIICKAWAVRTGQQFAKSAFTLDWQLGLIHCPNQVALPFTIGQVVRFPTQGSASCPLRQQCTTSKTGRSVSIHLDERLLQELKERQDTVAGRAKLRQRVAVEHTLAHIGHWQGDQARYRGCRKNLFDLRRLAVVHNLHVIARMPQPATGTAA